MIQGVRRGSRGVITYVPLGASSSRWRAVNYLATGECAFLFFTAVSVSLHPGFVLKWNEGGMSNYGLHIKTAIPYTLALALLVVYSAKAAHLYRGGDQRTGGMRALLATYSAVVSAVLVSTYFYSLNGLLEDLHFGLGTLLILTVGIGSIWMYGLYPPSIPVRALLLGQLLGDVLALLTVVGALHLLFTAEIVSNVGFAALAIRTARQLALAGV
jgi:hypothetical protein